jgi:hypothetical protein
MQRLMLGAVLVLAAISLSDARAQQTAGEVFQWTDANGTTHYSQTPPAKGAYKQRVINHSGAAVANKGPVTLAAENPQCATARSNIALLQSSAVVQQAGDGEGQPVRPLSAAERSSQLELAQAALKAYCTP